MSSNMIIASLVGEVEGNDALGRDQEGIRMLGHLAPGKAVTDRAFIS